jgi:hypothetical protein
VSQNPGRLRTKRPPEVGPGPGNKNLMAMDQNPRGSMGKYLAGEICQRHPPSRLDQNGGRQIGLDNLELCLEKSGVGAKSELLGAT